MKHGQEGLLSVFLSSSPRPKRTPPLSEWAGEFRIYSLVTTGMTMGLRFVVLNR